MPSLPEHLRSSPVGRQKLTRDVMEEHQRARIVEAAIEVFAKNGYPASSVDDVVNAARVGVGSFYALFDGKEECLLAAFRLVVDEARSLASSEAAAAEDWSGQVLLGLKAILEWVRDQPTFARIAIVEIRAGGPKAAREYEKNLRSISSFLEKGRKGADLTRPLPVALEQTTVTGIAWLLYRQLSMGSIKTLGGLHRELGQLILEPYLGEAKAMEAVSAQPVSLGA